jgi:hypothetical protein
MEGCGIDFAGGYGAVHLAVVFGVAYVDSELPGIDFEVFISRNILDVEFPCEHADVEVGEFWNLDGDLKIVARTTADLQSALAAVSFELDANIGRVVASTVGNTDLTLVRSANDDTAGAQAHAKLAAGGECGKKRIGVAGCGTGSGCGARYY